MSAHYVMTTWTIYERPDDYPNGYVVRGFEILSDGTVEPQPRPRFFTTLDEARAWIPDGCICAPRLEVDAPSIVETWL